MAKKSNRSGPLPFSATDIANMARSNPYIERLIEDPNFRTNVTTAVNSSKKAYARLNNGKVDPQALLQDRKLQAELGRALGAARDATIVLIARPRRRRRGLTFGRALMLAAIGGVLALAVSEGLRSKVLDVLFGAEEEFEYTPPTPTDSPAPSTTVGAA
jgi:hypothetical protein